MGLTSTSTVDVLTAGYEEPGLDRISFSEEMVGRAGESWRAATDSRGGVFESTGGFNALTRDDCLNYLVKLRL